MRIPPTVHKQAGGRLASLSPPRRRLVLSLLGLLVAGVLVGVVVVVLSLAPSPPKDRARVVQDQPGPVLLVPGYGGSSSSLESLRAVLAADGKDVQIVPLPDNAEGDLAAQAKALDAVVIATQRRTGAGSVDIVGYSAGGVVARIWARDDGGAARARRIVTLGSPHHGTELAALGTLLPSVCPTACQQLAPDSTVLADLNRGDETPAGPDWVSVWTTQDTVVVPADSARLAGARNVTVQSLCPRDRSSHTDLPRDPVAVRIVVAALGVRFGSAAPGC